LADRYGRYVLLNPARVERTTALFKRHGGKIISVARFIEGLRQANGIIAGIAGVTWRRFLFFNLIGAVLWTATWTSIGYASGSQIGPIYTTATRYDTYLLIGLGLALAAFVARHVWRRHRSRQIESSAHSDLVPTRSSRR
jgi:membrane protein DedA with SNARE-associated domain